MTAPELNEIFLRMMREALEQPTLELEQALKLPMAKLLLQTLVRSATSVEQEPVKVETTVGLTEFASSQSVIRAAIEDTFEVGELTATPAEKTALLEASDLVTIGGLRRLRLKDASRAEVLSAARPGDLYQRQLDELVRADTEAHEEIGRDPIRLPSAWLRSLLSGKFRDLDSAPPSELRAALAARDRLRLVRNLASNVPSSDELGRRVGLAELLEPLRLLIGAEGGWDGTPRRDRFVGRGSELTKLRGFVDELGSQSATEFVQRTSARAASAIFRSERPGLMILEAHGGLGKSALLAKFVLDHALDQSRQFPFAYLDFDRATLNPERPYQILLEVVRQLALQYPKAYADLTRLGDHIRAEFVQVAGDAAEKTADIADPFSMFAEIVREYATFGRRAFLLVFDTMEVVQWDPTAIGRLAWIIDQFRIKGLDELRVVASGRVDIPEFRQARGEQVPPIKIKLRPLPVADAWQMADKLGVGAIGDAWQAEWSSAIVGGGGANTSKWLDRILRLVTKARDDVRREPLAVRVAVNLIAQADAEERPRLAAEIAGIGVFASDDFVARLYEKRIISHVRDAKAGKLAWPGLVIRRITPEMAVELLAPLCGLSADEARSAFSALGQEVWMVMRESDGALKHLPHLRSRTLPLMRKKDEAKFVEVARAAVDYYKRRRNLSHSENTEWIYYRLLAGEDPVGVDADVTPEVLQSLASAVDDFAPQSPAASYIASRTARKRLSPARMRQLTPRDALHHLVVVAPNVFEFDDVTVDSAAFEVAGRLGTEALGDLLPWAQALWIKSGAWSRLTPAESAAELSGPTLRAHMYWMARTAGLQKRSTMTMQSIQLKENAGLSAIEEDRYDFRAMVQAMAVARLAVNGTDAFERLDLALANQLKRMKPSQLASTQAALRIAIVLGRFCQRPALSLWLAGRRRGSDQRTRSPTYSLAELRVLSEVVPDAKDLFPSGFESPKRFEDERLVAIASHFLDQFEGGESTQITGLSGRALARIFACRDEDWIVPLGYAAECALKGKTRTRIVDRLQGYHVEDLSTTPPDLMADALAGMFIADEAGDIGGYARFILEICGPDEPASADLARLLDYRQAWNEAISSILGPEAPSFGASKELATDWDERPAPGPVIDPDDLQKGRWGGKEELAGRRLRAVLESIESDVFYFSLIVESSDGSPLAAPVVFHLHDTYPRSVVTIRRIKKGREAKLDQWNAYGVFTVGAQVRDAKGRWISLELDLATLPSLPKRFLKR